MRQRHDARHRVLRRQHGQRDRHGALRGERLLGVPDARAQPVPGAVGLEVAAEAHARREVGRRAVEDQLGEGVVEHLGAHVDRPHRGDRAGAVAAAVDDGQLGGGAADVDDEQPALPAEPVRGRARTVEQVELVGRGVGDGRERGEAGLAQRLAGGRRPRRRVQQDHRRRQRAPAPGLRPDHLRDERRGDVDRGRRPGPLRQELRRAAGARREVRTGAQQRGGRVERAGLERGAAGEDRAVGAREHRRRHAGRAVDGHGAHAHPAVPRVHVGPGPDGRGGPVVDREGPARVRCRHDAVAPPLTRRRVSQGGSRRAVRRTRRPPRGRAPPAGAARR